MYVVVCVCACVCVCVCVCARARDRGNCDKTDQVNPQDTVIFRKSLLRCTKNINRFLSLIPLVVPGHRHRPHARTRTHARAHKHTHPGHGHFQESLVEVEEEHKPVAFGDTLRCEKKRTPRIEKGARRAVVVLCCVVLRCCAVLLTLLWLFR